MLNENDNLTSGGRGTSVQFTITLSNRGGSPVPKKIMENIGVRIDAEEKIFQHHAQVYNYPYMASFGNWQGQRPAKDSNHLAISPAIPS